MLRNSDGLYEIYKRNHSDLLSAAESQFSIVNELRIDNIQKEGTKPGEVVQGLIHRLRSDSFRVLVIGCFSAGKSTFLNAMMGANLLPTSPNPTTGVLCEISYATEQEKKATLYPKPGLGPNGGSEPFEITEIDKLCEELGKYVKIDHMREETPTSRYQKLTLQWPLEICQNGVTLIDSVGLDDPDSRHDITLDYAKSADAILYLVHSGNAYSGADASAIKLLRAIGYESPFFVVTCYDIIRDSAAFDGQPEQEFKDIVLKSLVPLTDLGIGGIKFVAARARLNGRIKGDAALIADSGILEVESALETFLVREKGRAKLVTSMRSLRSVNKMVRQLIPTRIQLLQTETKELEKRYAEAEVPLRNLQEKRKLLVNKVNHEINDIARDAYDLADIYFSELLAKLKVWAKEYKVEGKISFPPVRRNIEPVVNEIVTQLTARIEEDVADWNKTTLSPMLTQSVEAMQNEFEEQAREFLRSVETVRLQITVGSVDGAEIARKNEPSIWNRLGGLGYTLLTGDIVTGGLGMVLGVKAMLKTIVCQIIAAILLIVFNLFNPVAIVIAALAAIFAGNFLNILTLTEAVKRTVGEKMSEAVDQKRKEMTKGVERAVKDELGKLKDAQDSGLQAEISGLRDEVENELAERRRGKTNVEAQIRKLEQLKRDNDAIDDRLDSIYSEIELSTHPGK